MDQQRAMSVNTKRECDILLSMKVQRSGPITLDRIYGGLTSATLGVDLICSELPQMRLCIPLRFFPPDIQSLSPDEKYRSL